jgi:hypothetical protein
MVPVVRRFEVQRLVDLASLQRRLRHRLDTDRVNSVYQQRMR